MRLWWGPVTSIIFVITKLSIFKINSSFGEGTLIILQLWEGLKTVIRAYFVNAERNFKLRNRFLF